MKNKSLVAEARRTQYEMTEGFYDPEIMEQDADKFVQIDKSQIPASLRNDWVTMGADLAEKAGVSQEAAENAILGRAIQEWTDAILSMTPQEIANYKAELRRQGK